MYNTDAPISVSDPIYDIAALDGIMEAYVANPELIKTMYLKEEDMPSVVISDHKWLLEILHICSNKGYKELPQDLINNVISTYDTKFNPPDNETTKKARAERLKNHFRGLKELAELSPESLNAESHYSTVKKCITLNKLRDLGYDVSPFYCPDCTDPAKKNLAKTNFDTKTETEILDYYRTSTMSDMDTIKTDLSIKSSQIPCRARNLPGYDKKSEYIIDDWMEFGTFNSIIGAAKAGKTQLTMQMAFAVQNGLNFWDHKTQQRDVLYVDFELRPQAIAQRFNFLRMYYSDATGKTLTQDNTEDMWYLSVSDDFGNDRVDLDSILDACRLEKTKNPKLGLIIFDCFYTFAEGDPNLEQDAKDTLKKLKALVDDKTTVCYVHHTNKAGFNNSTDVIYAAGGSGVHGKIVDTTYVVYPIVHPKDVNRTILGFAVSTTGRSSTGGTHLCDRDESSHWFFKPRPKDGNQDGEQHFDSTKPKTKEEQDYSNLEAQEIKECQDQLKSETLNEAGYWVDDPEDEFTSDEAKINNADDPDKKFVDIREER